MKFEKGDIVRDVSDISGCQRAYKEDFSRCGGLFRVTLGSKYEDGMMKVVPIDSKCSSKSGQYWLVKVSDYESQINYINSEIFEI